MRMKMLLAILLLAAVLFTLGLIQKGGFGPPPRFLAGIPKDQPPCPEPLILQTPVDMSQVTSILYPGQERGGDFKPHGGFRFDNATSNAVEVRAAMDATFDDASRYIEGGEVQYMFDFQSDCGIRYRFDHLLTLAPKFAAIADELPDAEEHNSRTVRVKPIRVKAGELIATAVGFQRNRNVFVDFGVYDLRGKGRTNPRPYAVCWFDLLPMEDATKVKSLPSGDSQNGTRSTLCR